MFYWLFVAADPPEHPSSVREISREEIEYYLRRHKLKFWKKPRSRTKRAGATDMNAGTTDGEKKDANFEVKFMERVSEIDVT